MRLLFFSILIGAAIAVLHKDLLRGTAIGITTVLVAGCLGIALSASAPREIISSTQYPLVMIEGKYSVQSAEGGYHYFYRDGEVVRVIPNYSTKLEHIDNVKVPTLIIERTAPQSKIIKWLMNPAEQISYRVIFPKKSS